MHPTTLSNLVAQHIAERHADAIAWRLVRQAKARPSHSPMREWLRRMYRRPLRRHDPGQNVPSFSRFVAVAVLALGALVTAMVPTSASSGATSPAASQRAGPASASAAGPVMDGVAGSVLSVHGAGPYRIGARLQALQEAGLIDWVAPQPGCDIVFTGVTGDWAGVLILAFRNGRLVEAGTATTPPRSPAGASVGMDWSQLEDIYGSRGRLIHNNDGDQAYVVRIGSRVELYTGHPIREGVGYFQAGPANFVLRNFMRGSVC
jgi:hypothetical protein